MLFIPFLLYYTLLSHYNVDATEYNASIGIIILSQPNKYHEKLFQRIEKDIMNQAENFQIVKIFSSYLLGSDVGHWTIFPLLEKLASFTELQWFLFLEESTGINLRTLFNVFKKYNSSEDVFVGYVLQDTEPTIIHHFADQASLLYPHFSSGFFISSSLIQRLISRLPVDDAYSFSIDPKYELYHKADLVESSSIAITIDSCLPCQSANFQMHLKDIIQFAKFIWDSSNGVKLQHENQFCLVKDNEDCATWVQEKFPDCGMNVEKLQISVKTCHKFHHSRISVMKNTWAFDVENLLIFSDKEDELIPTIKVPVENVERGHCEKTLFIMRHYLDKNIDFDWLAIVDDDTIISIRRLEKLLLCYNASDTLAIGERYGYSVANGLGYDYITGGGGMVFSHSTLKLLTRHCQCPSIDSPDDMIIGMCLKRLGIPITHSPYFHQARPVDYTPDFLKPLQHISFHKHWLIDPYVVYYEWLQETPNKFVHAEL